MCTRGHIAIMYLVMAIALVLALPVSASAAVSNHTVSGVSPRGTTINLFDYWIDSQDASDQGNPSNWQNLGINRERTLLFGCGMDKIPDVADYNQWTKSSAPRTGIVSSILGEDGYPVLSGSLGGSSLSYLFDSSNFEGKAAYMDVDGLLQVDDDGYYYYKRQENFAEFDEKMNSFTLYDQGGVEAAGSSPDGQFFPFNSATGVFYERLNSLESNGTKSTDAKINHYFGLSMSTRFVQQDGGYTAPAGTSGRKKVTYNFSGDDDVWIYIDGVLVGDLGGIHNATSIQIDFSTGDVLVYRDGNGSGEGTNNQYDEHETVYQQTTIYALFKAAGVEDSYLWRGNTFADDTYHTLDFFYLERGNTDSNMSLKYNLVNIPESGVVKIDQSGTPLSGVQFTLRQADASYEIVEGGMSISAETDETGEMIFTTENASGQEMPITLEQLQERGDYWVLTEDEVPEGYRSSGDMHLRFENGVLLSSNEWDTGAWSQPHVTVTAPTTVREYDDPGKTHPSDGGVMFAVVFQKGEDGGWFPVSGNAYLGWDVAEGNETSDIVAAAKADGYQFLLGSGGAYEVTVENLPGDIGAYEYVLESHEGSADEAQYTVRYFWADAGSLNAINEDTKVVRIDADADTGYEGMGRVFSVTLNVPNIKNELTLKKTDADTGEPLAGVSFSLYKDGDRDGTADSDVTPATMTTNENGELSVYSDADGQVLAEGSYVLVEGTPDGYVDETKPIRIVVDDEGVHVDAGAADDNVKVETGVGSLVYSMRGFAAGDDVDATLHDVKAQAQMAGSYDGAETSWEDADAAETHYQYDDQGGTSLAYVANGSFEGNGDETYTAEAGWSRLDIRQCAEHKGDASGSPKENLGDQSLNALFTGDVTIHVTNKAIDNDVDYSGRVTLNVSKTLNGRDMKEGEFAIAVAPANDASAQLLGLDGEDETLEIEMGAANDGEKFVSDILDDRDITLDKEDAGTYTYTVSEKNPEENQIGGVTYDTTEYELTIQVSAGDDGTVSVTTSVKDGEDINAEETITSADDTTAEIEIPFVNEYEAKGELGGDSEGIVARKTLENGTLSGDDFTFTVSAQNADGTDTYVAATAKNSADGSITFPAITYTTESLAADVETGYAQRSQDAEGNDTYTYSYVVAEDTTGFDEAGLSTSKSSYVVEVVVTDDGSGSFSVSVSYPADSEDGLEFVNVYGADAAASLSVGGTKLYETNGLGDAPDIDGKYTFTLTGVDEDGNDAPLPESTEATNADGSFSFGTIAYDIEDLDGADSKTFTYTVTESGSVDGVTNDADAETGKTFIVTLRDNHDGTISIDDESLSVAGNQVSFTNTYTEPTKPPVTPPAQTEPDPSDPSKPNVPVTKTLTGRDMVAGEFSFTITATGNNASKVTPSSLTGTNDASGNVSFSGDGFTFTEAGDYTFTVSEVLPADEDPDTPGVQHNGVTYDATTYTVTAHVTNRNGKLVATWETQDGARSFSFSNSYEPSETAQIVFGATKVLNGRDLVAGEFSFELRDAQGNVVATATNAADGSVTFATPVEFTEAGTYTYTVSEVSGSLANVTYDTTVHTATVTVTDNGDGTLTATVSYDGTGQLPVFTNTYVAPEEPSEPQTPGTTGTSGTTSKPSAPEVPDTGDHMATGLPAVLAACGIALAAGAVAIRRLRSK